MKLGGAPPQEAGRVEVAAHGLGRYLRQLQPARLRQAPRQDGWRRTDELWRGEEMGQGVERVLPGVALVRHVSLQDRDRHGLALGAAVLEAPRQWRDLAEARLLGEEPADLELGVHPFLEAAEHLQHQALAEDHRVVALLGHRQLCLEAYGLGPTQAGEP